MQYPILTVRTTPGWVYWVYRQLPRLITIAYRYQFELLYIYEDRHPYFLVLAYASWPSITAHVVTEQAVLASRGRGVYRNQSYWPKVTK